METENQQNIGKLAKALAAAQGDIQSAKKDKSNPFFKSKYADLASVWAACREQLSKNEIAVIQAPCVVDGVFGINTRLIHSSGEEAGSFMPVSASITAKAQEMGSAITYARRYALSAMVGVAPDDDDDGNAATQSTFAVQPVKRDEVDLVTGLINKIETLDTIEQLDTLISNRATAKYLNKWKDERPDDYSYIMGLIEAKRAGLEDATG